MASTNSQTQLIQPQPNLPTVRRVEPARAAPAQPPLTFTAIANSLLRWWKVALPASILLAVAAAGGVWWTFVPKYRSAAWLQIQETPTHLAYPTHDNPRRFIQNQIELLRSPLVLGPVVSDPEIASLPEIAEQEEPLTWLPKRLRVSNLGDSELYEVSFDSREGASAARLVNAVVNSYLKLRTEQDSTRNQRMIELLDAEKSIRAAEVTRLRENVRELAKQINGKDPFSGNPTGEVVVMNHPLERLMNQLTTAEVERKMLEVQLEAFEGTTESALARSLPKGLLDAAVEKHADVQELKALIKHKDDMLRRIAETSKLGDKDPAYLRVAKDLENWKQSLTRKRASLRSSVAEEINANAALKQEDQAFSVRQSLAAKKAAEKTYREQYEAQLKLAGQSGNQSLDLEFARAELAREEKVFELIAQRALALRTETGAPSRVTLMKSAVPPAAPLEKYPWKLMLMAAGAVFCVPWGLAIGWERLVRRISNSDQLDSEAVHVVGEVARLPVRTHASPDTLQRDLTLFEESVDSLRTCLVLGESCHGVKVIAVASAVSGEGKTSIAAQLAVSIARATRQKTLIIDTDLRSPDVHRVFQLPELPGLAAVLDGQLPWREAVNTQWSEFVHVLPAGRAGANPHSLINNGRLHQMLAEAREEYAFVIIDTPPILLASESLAIAKEADGTLLCTMRDYSRQAQVQTACKRLQAVGARTLGAVLSGIPAHQYAYKYGHQYPYTR